MLRKITRNNRLLLLTGVLMQQAEAEKLKTGNEKSLREQVEESTNILGINNLGSRRNFEEEQRHRKKELDSQISGWERVKMAFLAGKKDKELGPELSFAVHLAETGSICGFLYGGMREYVKAVHLFLYTNDTSKFLNVKEAKVALVKASMQAFFKGALFTAPKVGALCAIFGVSNATLALYNGKNGSLEFSLAGAITTAVMKWNLGIRGMISGCVTGGLTGLFLGSMVSILMLPTGNSFSDFQYLLYNIQNSKREWDTAWRWSGVLSYIVFVLFVCFFSQTWKKNALSASVRGTYYI